MGPGYLSLLLRLFSQRFLLSLVFILILILYLYSHVLTSCFILILVLISLFSKLPKLLTIGSYPQTGKAAMQVGDFAFEILNS